MYNYFNSVLTAVSSGDAMEVCSKNFKEQLVPAVKYLRSRFIFIEEDINLIRTILTIGNLTYNNLPFDDDNMPVDNGVYDLLLEMYKNMGYVPQVGAPPIQFINVPEIKSEVALDQMPMVTFYDKFDKLMYKEELFKEHRITKEVLEMESTGYQSDKKYRAISHNNPTLVGTLDKCKFVLNAQAEDKGVMDDPSVKILERDFFGEHFRRGLINQSMIFKMVLELKYDGVSVVVTIRDGKVIAAVSRGDTGMDKATDLSPILFGYSFPNLPALDIDIDVKCEAVMTYADLYAFNVAKGRIKDPYKNCRSAIIGLFSANDGYLYQQYITLVPLAVAATNQEDNAVFDELDRVDEIEFMNKYLATKEILRYVYIEDTYDKMMFQVKKFVDEADYARPLLRTMYDGVVVSYLDKDLRQALGRENSINKFSVAVKFNPMKKRTRLLGITYTVGQNGVVTPMAHYEPVEFIGTIHTKSSISSVSRFLKNDFKIGNIVEVEYRNEVMPYLTTPTLEENILNPNPILKFINRCPECGTELVISSSGKSAICPNIACKARTTARMANMMDKLGLKDFAEASMEKIARSNFHELFDIRYEDIVNDLGETNSRKFLLRIESLKVEPIYDFQIVGALGFTDIASETWKKIFAIYTLSEIMLLYKQSEPKVFKRILSSIKGIGPNTADTICNEMEFFLKDLELILTMQNVNTSVGLKQPTIRITGIRDKELMEYLCSLGYDASDKSVNSETDILIVPAEGHKSSKVSKAGPDTIIVPIQDFKANMNMYLDRI